MATPDEQAAIRAAEQRTAEAEQQTVSAEQRLLRFEVARELGLDKGMASRLVGRTRDELVADAKELGAAIETEREAAAEAPATMNDFIRAKAGRQPERPRQTGPHDDINAHIRAVAGR